MSRGRVWIMDRREVHIPLPDGCISWTPAGRVPLRCERAEITFDIPTGRLGSVTVWGYLRDQADIDRRARTLSSYGRERARDIMVRRYKVDWSTHTADLPDWLVELVEQYRPGGPE